MTIPLIVGISITQCMIYQRFECDFIERTMKIIKQYEDFVENNKNIQDEEKFEVTLLINCLLGLLVLPKQKHIHNIPQIPVSQLAEKWDFREEFIERWGNVQENMRDLPYIVLRMRNSVAHMNITILGNGETIEFIEFNDDKYSNNIFKAKIPVKNLKTFVKNLAKSIIGRYP